MWNVLSYIVLGVCVAGSSWHLEYDAARMTVDCAIFRVQGAIAPYNLLDHTYKRGVGSGEV